MLSFEHTNGHTPPAPMPTLDDVRLQLAIAERQVTLVVDDARGLLDAALHQWNLTEAWARATRHQFAALQGGETALAAQYAAEATALMGQRQAAADAWQAAHDTMTSQQVALGTLVPPVAG